MYVGIITRFQIGSNLGALGHQSGILFGRTVLQASWKLGLPIFTHREGNLASVLALKWQVRLSHFVLTCSQLVHFSFCVCIFADLLAFFLCMFFSLLSFVFLFTFWWFWVPFGVHLACFLECLGTSKMEPERWWEYDSQTLDLLLSGLISRPDFATDFFKTFRIFKHFGAPVWRPFGCPCPFRLGPIWTYTEQFLNNPWKKIKLNLQEVSSTS